MEEASIEEEEALEVEDVEGLEEEEEIRAIFNASIVKIMSECWSDDKQQANFACEDKEDEELKLFMCQGEETNHMSSIWFVTVDVPII